ncbi:MAG: murein biosynthesis integral membrane protein MurJ [Clostridiales bacterium]|nr:murein biosynthesis integral membrane protein MurJ [Clostridiales bacterium]
MSSNNGIRENKTRKTGMALATALVMLGLVFSKMSGFLRDIFVGMKFSPVYRDSFTLAFVIPDIVFNLLIGGAIQSAVTPTMSAYLTKNKEEQGWRVVSIFISFFALLLLVVCAIGIIFAEPLYTFFYSKDNSPETCHLAAQASKWLFPQIFFMMLAALSIGILNSYKRFASTAFGPTIYNIFVLLSIILFAKNTETGLTMTTAGIMGAAVIYFLFQFFIGFDKLSKFRFELDPADKEFRIMFRKALPILISASVVQINMAVLKKFALDFPDSGNTYLLQNASTIWQLPYGIFAVALGNVMLPSLAGLFEEKRYKDCSELLSSRLRSALFLTVPSAVFLFLMNFDVIKAAFQWNDKYTDDDAKKAGLFLMGYCIAIISHSVVFIMNQAFYAIGKTKIPLIAGSICLVSNPVMCIYFRNAGMGLISLTFAYSITSVIQMIILCVIYSRSKDLRPVNMITFFVKCFCCASVMCVALLITDNLIPGQGGKIHQLIILSGKGIICLIIYFVLAIVLKMPEANEWIKKARAKLKR